MRPAPSAVTWVLIALTGIDIDHQLLPDDLTLPLLWAGLLASVVVRIRRPIPARRAARRPHRRGRRISEPVVGIYHAFRLVTGKEGMGYGDFKLFAALGAWLGWQATAPGDHPGGGHRRRAGHLLMIAFRGRDRASPMPFGPYLAAAGWLAMMYGSDLVGGYLRLSGLSR